MKLTRCFLFFLLFVAGCTEDNPVVPNELSTVSLPLGRTWIYYWSSTIYDSGGVIRASMKDTFSVAVASVSDTVGSLKNLIRLEAVSLTQSGLKEKIWYSVSAEELREVAYYSPFGVIVVPGRADAVSPHHTRTLSFRLPYLIYQQNKWNSILDSAIQRTDPRIVYRFPLISGMEWVSFQVPFLQIRRVIDVRSFDFGMGSKLHAVIRTTLDWAGPLHWYDYVAADGLMRREITIDSLAITSEQSPEIVRYGKAVEILEFIK